MGAARCPTALVPTIIIVILSVLVHIALVNYTGLTGSHLQNRTASQLIQHGRDNQSRCSSQYSEHLILPFVDSTETASANTKANAPKIDSEALDTDDADWELDLYEIEWGSMEDYQLLTKLGEGEYSEAFRSVDLRNNRSCVTKLLKPVSLRSIKREIKILQDLSGGPNILQFVDAAMSQHQNETIIVTEYVNNTYYRSLYRTFSDYEVRFYMFQLLRALDYAHQKSIMHRDIKPHNLLIEHESQKLRLIDWGLSDYYDENYAYTTSVGSRFWRAPEILVDYAWYTLSADIWSFGCMLAALVFAQEPFFMGRYNNANQLIKIAEVLGTEDLFNWLDKYQIELPEQYSNVSSWHERKDWSHFVNKKNHKFINNDVLDLLNRTLVYDHKGRLSASEALLHPYFDPVRAEAMSHANSTTSWDVQ